MQRPRNITDRADADVHRDVLHALLLDRLVPMTVDAQVRDGVVTLTGTVGSQRERALLAHSGALWCGSLPQRP